MNSALKVRRLETSDAELAMRAILQLKSGIEPDAARDYRAMSDWLANPNHVLIVATAERAPVGFALGYLLQRVGEPAPMLFFYEIEVHEDARRQGIGTQLLGKMKSVAGQVDACKMWVQTSPDNAGAQALYQSQGGVLGTQPDCVYTWDSRSLAPKRD